MFIQLQSILVRYLYIIASNMENEAVCYRNTATPILNYAYIPDLSGIDCNSLLSCSRLFTHLKLPLMRAGLLTKSTSQFCYQHNAGLGIILSYYPIYILW